MTGVADKLQSFGFHADGVGADPMRAFWAHKCGVNIDTAYLQAHVLTSLPRKLSHEFADDDRQHVGWRLMLSREPRVDSAA